MQNGFLIKTQDGQFESFVNSERCKTARIVEHNLTGLRALLIQKDAKQYIIKL